MMIQPLNYQQQNQNESSQVNPQIEIQKDQLRQAIGASPNSLQSQLLQLVASGIQNPQQAQATAQAQISKGFLDIKI